MRAEIAQYLRSMNDQNRNEYVKTIVEEIGHTNNASTDQMDKLYFIYNKIYGMNETNKACGGCRERIWKGLQRYYSENNLSK